MTKKSQEHNPEEHNLEKAAIDSAGSDSNVGGGFFIVGIGASAGGLEAYGQFFDHMPSDSGLAFILVPHLEPTHKGMMPELISRHTKMEVVEVSDGAQVQPNCVYVIAPNTDLAIFNGKLQVLEPIAARGQRAPIDFFFRHLAADQKENAVAIILSGMGSDGTQGLKPVKENLGIVMVQDPESAKYDSMPRNAINTGTADCIAAAQDLPAKLMQFVVHAPPKREQRTPLEGDVGSSLQKVFALLRAKSGNNFSCYKRNTIHRRIERRMAIHQFNSMPRYVRFLQENPQEVELLYKELLIGVTNFFRDPGLFDALKKKAIPLLLQSHAAGNPLRVWNPACSTGEETFSLAIVLKECLEALSPQDVPIIQIFATDLDKDAIERARRGTFSAGIATDVSPERLDRYFHREDGGYRVRREIRDLVVFAPENLLVDSPFTRLDILCCRNFLIYVNIETQQKLLPLMHYALNPKGLLILGTAESIGGFERLFSSIESKWKIFQRREVLERPLLEMPAGILPRHRPDDVDAKEPREKNMDITYSVQRELLDSYGPPSVLVNVDGDILYVNGRTGKYLEPSSGKVNNNVFAMAREGLREELVHAIRKAVTNESTVTTGGITVKTNGDSTTINVTVKPYSERSSLRGMLLIVFEETIAARAKATTAVTPSLSSKETEPNELEDEVRRLREHLQANVEEREATQEELRAANEELQSNNEELQSTNEELNSSKEELQSINEEMQTVNAELQAKIEELSRSNSDMKNLLNGIEMATIFLNNDLAITQFTPETTRIINLVASDVGRPLVDFATKLKYAALVDDARRVLDTLIVKVSQAQASDGRWYNIRILPYRTLSNAIDGVVMTFADITAMKEVEQSLRREKAEAQTARTFAEGIVATIREPLVVLDADLRISSASAAFYSTFQVKSEETEGRLIYEIGEREWDTIALRRLLEDILPKSSRFDGFQVEANFPGIGKRKFSLNARQIKPEIGPVRFILLAMEDITAATAVAK